MNRLLQLLILSLLWVSGGSCVREPVTPEHDVLSKEFDPGPHVTSIKPPQETGSGSRAGAQLRRGETRSTEAGGQQANPSPSSSEPSRRAEEPTLQPVFPQAGRVVRVNPELEFVVLEFLPGRMPEKGTEMSVVRGGKSVGKVKVSAPRVEETVPADIIEGAVRRGDIVRKEKGEGDGGKKGAN